MSAAKALANPDIFRECRAALERQGASVHVAKRLDQPTVITLPPDGYWEMEWWRFERLCLDTYRKVNRNANGAEANG